MSEQTGVMPEAYVVGGGSLASLTRALLEKHGVRVHAYIDEQAASPKDDLPVLRATQVGGLDISERTFFALAISFDEYRDAAAARLRAQGVAPERMLSLRANLDPVFLGSLFETRPQAVLDYLAHEPLSDIQAMEQALLADQRAAADLRSPESSLLSFNYYGRGGGFRQHLNVLASRLSEQHDVVCYSDELDTPGESSPNLQLQSYLSSHENRQADLALTAHFLPCSHPDTPKVTFMHVIYDYCLFEQVMVDALAQARRHYVFTSSEPCFESMQELCLRRGLDNDIVLIPGGYPRLDNNIRQFQAMDASRDTIIYAPTGCMWDADEMHLTYSIVHAPQILAALADNFPEHRIVFRPHPTDLQYIRAGKQATFSDQMREALAFCERHPNCVLDDTRTDYMHSYGAAALMVSDTSSTAFTYAFSTGRPVVFYSPGSKQMDTELARFRYVRDRHELGVCVDNTGALVEAVRDVLDRYPHYVERVGRHGEKVLFNKGASEQYFIDNLDYILRNERHPDWWYLQDHRRQKAGVGR